MALSGLPFMRSNNANSSKNVLAAGLLSPVSGLVQGRDRRSSHQSISEITEYIGITTTHWVDGNTRQVCRSRSCRTKFNLIMPPKNCHRCGEVYCKQCLKQTRRLNIYANYDPQGKFYKVCETCFDSEEQKLGATRGLMSDYRNLRTAHRRRPQHHPANSKKSEWERAEERIIKGFLAEVNSTPNLVRMVQSLTVNFIKGAWKKPIKPISGHDNVCWGCTREFEMIFRPQRQCSICGAAVCETCSNKDLVVYVPDELLDDDTAGYQIAKLRLIKLQGGPTKEPQIHDYLRVCGGCYSTKKGKQLQNIQDVVDGKHQQTQQNFWDMLVPFHDKLLTDQRHIEQSLEKYETLVRSLEDGTHRSSMGHNTQILSKSQIDLNDLFYNYLKSTGRLKSFKPITANTETLLINIQRATSKFYRDNKGLFLELKTRLSEYLPPAVIETIQNQVNENALICVHLLVRQLGLEVLSLATNQLADRAMSIAKRLADAEEVVDDELKRLIPGEGWEEHVQLMNEMVKLELQNNKLIRPATTSLARPDYLLNDIIDRCCIVIDQISLQLTAKTTHSSYTAVKDTIADVKNDILKLACSQVP